jgi:hypothetical protein
MNDKGLVMTLTHEVLKSVPSLVSKTDLIVMIISRDPRSNTPAVLWNHP